MLFENLYPKFNCVSWLENLSPNTEFFMSKELSDNEVKQDSFLTKIFGFVSYILYLFRNFTVAL